MAGKFSRWFRTEDDEPPRRDKTPRLSNLQQSILQWLRNEVRRRQRAGDPVQIPYPTLVSAIHADKVAITGDVRRLLRKGFVEVTLPPGSWVRYITLTEQGDTQARRVTGDTGNKRDSEEGPLRRTFSRRKKS